MVFLLLGIRSDCTLVHHVGLLTCPECIETPGASHGKTPCTPMHERHQVPDLATMSGAVDSPSHQDSAAVCAGSYSYSSPYIFGFEVLGLGDPPKLRPPQTYSGDSLFPFFYTSTGSLPKIFAFAHAKGAHLSRCMVSFYIYCVLVSHGEHLIRFPGTHAPWRHGGRSINRLFGARLRCVAARHFVMVYTNVSHIH